ncbi:hypothetical protein BCR44DRAFT_37582 [Catenaria anguillulae PL171]|uniref:Ankyrin repeat-containing domain protein n=1 Tax=Catenaria anguillulae PL171 TaxID=765915 RepID=A0A1Y2HV74_9FUNG|nr:hypothetical protein BCR44DRAFT_37582 [Catenaria anguillulae PL171]
MDHALSLPVELAEPILVAVIRHFTLPAADGSSCVVCPALNTLSRTLVPDVPRAALIKLWWYSLDDIPPCSTSWLLPMLLDLEQHYDRPLMYSVKGLGNAARRGDFATMDAWFESGLLDGLASTDGDETDSTSLCIARHDGTEGEYILQVLDWWLERGLPWGDKEAIESDLVIASSSSSVSEDVCIQALDWWRARQEVMVTAAPTAALVAASRAGYVRVLEWWWTHFESSIECTYEALDAAVEGGGHLHVLEWWAGKFPLDRPLRDNGKKLQASVLKRMANLASKHGHVHILQWWFHSVAGLSKAYSKRTESAIDHAAAQGHIAVLDFWLVCSTHSNEHRRISFQYKHALDWACAAGQIQVLDWFAAHCDVAGLQSSNPCPLQRWPDGDSCSITIECLEWRQRHKIPTRFSVQGMATMSRQGRLDVLEWISSNKVGYDSGYLPLVEASQSGHVSVLEWWLNELGIEQVHKLASMSSQVTVTGHLSVLQWLADKQVNLTQLGLNGSPFMRDPQLVVWAIDCAGANPDVVVRECIDLCAANGDYEAMDWCLRTYPTAARQALNLTRLRYRLDKVQFGLLEFLVEHGFLPVVKMSYEHALLADSIDQEQLSSLIEGSGTNLALLDWIHKHYQLDATDRSHVFALTPADVESAKQYGDLGLLRWLKRRKIEIRELGVDGDYFGSDFGVGDW